MIYFEVAVSLFFLLCSIYFFLRLSVKYFLFLFFFIATSFVGFFSVVYISFSGVYLLEQGVNSYYNSSYVYLSVLIFLSVFSIYMTGRIKLESEGCASHINIIGFRVSEIVVVLFLLVFLFFLYLNILLTGEPPLLSSNYIDRFSYLENSRLWFFLSFFGAVSVHIPILLGFFFVFTKNKISYCLIFFVYLVYLLLIGQKFGGVVLALSWFLIPFLAVRFRKFDFLGIFRKGFWVIIFFIPILLVPVYFHYSNYSLSENYGGPIGLIVYRIFGMQGHLHWGVFNHISWFGDGFLNFKEFMHSMQNMMLLVSPYAPDMIERGVNFTFGFYAASLYYFTFLAPFVVFASFFSFGLLSRFLYLCILRKDFLIYFLCANFFVMYASYLSTGSLSYVLTIKSFALVLILFCVLIFRKLIKYFSYR